MGKLVGTLSVQKRPPTMHWSEQSNGPVPQLCSIDPIGLRRILFLSFSKIPGASSALLFHPLIRYLLKAFSNQSFFSVQQLSF
jgi:hypothetical protein